MAIDYFEQKQGEYLLKLEEIQNVLPECAIAFLNAKSGKYEASTRLRYATDIKIFLEYACEAVHIMSGISPAQVTNQMLDAITPADIDGYMAYLQKFEYNDNMYKNGQSSRKRKLATLRSFYKWMFSRGLVKGNPASLVDTPKLSAPDIIVFDEDDRCAIMSAVETGENLTPLESARLEKKGRRDKAILYILLGTGIRVSELVGLDIDDVNLKQRRLTVIRKGAKNDHVYFGDDVSAALEEYMKTDRKNAKIAPDKFDEVTGERLTHNENALFISQKGNRLSVRQVELMVKKYCRGTQFDPRQVKPHKFRSSFASKAVEDNDLSAVAAALGHANTSTTSRYYTKVREEAKRRVADTAFIRNNT